MVFFLNSGKQVSCCYIAHFVIFLLEKFNFTDILILWTFAYIEEMFPGNISTLCVQRTYRNVYDHNLTVTVFLTHSPC